MSDNSEIQLRYQRALESLVETLKEDRTVLAAILGGSLSYDQVWERSDIDLMIVTTEDLKGPKSLTLTVDGIMVQASVYPRGKFKQSIQSATHSSFFHSYFAKSTLLFTKDETITDLYQDATHVGNRDREVQTLRFIPGILYALTKGEKWFKVRGDMHYAFLYVLNGMDDLAGVEILSHGEMTTREKLPRAMQLNPEFFGQVYTGLIDGPKDAKAIGEAIEAVRNYLKSRPEIFQPIFEYLQDAHGPRSATEIEHYFEMNFGLKGAAYICEWLAEEEMLHKASTPVRVTEKSRVTVEEAAFMWME